VGTWTAQNLLEAWQVKFGVLDPKWHQRFLADPLTLKILEFDIAEIQLCIDAPAGSVYSGWWYSEEEATGRKKLVYILRHLEYEGARRNREKQQIEDETARQNRKPLGTFSRKIEATGSSLPDGTSVFDVEINNNLSHDE